MQWLTCTFDSNASRDDIGITTHNWNFGDGPTRRETSVFHTRISSGGHIRFRSRSVTQARRTNTSTRKVTATGRCTASESAAGGRFHGLVRRGPNVYTRRPNLHEAQRIVSYPWNLGKFPEPQACGPVVTAPTRTRDRGPSH